jgi:transposase
LKDNEALVFFDEAGVCLDPTIYAMWAPIGDQPQLPSDSRRRRLNLGGWINPIERKHGVIRIERGNTSNFLKCLDQIEMEHQNKEIITVLCDNAPFHKGHDVDAYLYKHSKIKLWHIPKYSPNLNLQEWEWKNMRQFATHCRRFFDDNECWSVIRNHFETYDPISLKPIFGSKSLISNPLFIDHIDIMADTDTICSNI